MEPLLIVFALPFLLLLLGFVFISLVDVGGTFVFLAVILLFVLIGSRAFRMPNPQSQSVPEQLDRIRRIIITFSIAILFPLFIQQIVLLFDKELGSIIIGLIIGFGVVIWGMFMKSYKVLMYSNIFGGAISVGYLYTQLWALGDVARIVAAGFGLVIAVSISIIKLKDKLT